MGHFKRRKHGFRARFTCDGSRQTQSPDWIALKNGTTHGIQESGKGIQVDLTMEIHEALSLYKISGAQHGTSGSFLSFIYSMIIFMVSIYSIHSIFWFF